MPRKQRFAPNKRKADIPSNPVKPKEGMPVVQAEPIDDRPPDTSVAPSALPHDRA